MTEQFFYDVPTRITSNVAIDVCNQDGKVVYTMQKYHKNMIQKLLALHFTTWFIHVSLKDQTEKELVRLEDIGIAKRKWSLDDVYGNEGVIVTDTSTWKMTERKLSFQIGNNHYLVSKEDWSQQTILYEESEPIVIMEENSKIPPRKNYITFLEENRLPVPTVLCILHLFEIGI